MAVLEINRNSQLLITILVLLLVLVAIITGICIKIYIDQRSET